VELWDAKGGRGLVRVKRGMSGYWKDGSDLESVKEEEPPMKKSKKQHRRSASPAGDEDSEVESVNGGKEEPPPRKESEQQQQKWYTSPSTKGIQQGIKAYVRALRDAGSEMPKLVWPGELASLSGSPTTPRPQPASLPSRLTTPRPQPNAPISQNAISPAALTLAIARYKLINRLHASPPPLRVSKSPPPPLPDYPIRPYGYPYVRKTPRIKIYAWKLSPTLRSLTYLSASHTSAYSAPI
jgi:hypothetical protein